MLKHLKSINEIYHNKIIDLIEPNTKVLDLGCGNGELLEKLIHIKSVKGYGIEIDHAQIIECVKKNVPVFQENIDYGLREFSDQSFDYVILSQTLQEVQKPLFVLSEMLRVGKKAIIAFPNFAYWKIRLQVLKGKAPKTDSLPFDWHDTPNIRIVTIHDFRMLCKKNKLKIIKEIPLFHHAIWNLCSLNFSNFFAEQGVFVLEKHH